MGLVSVLFPILLIHDFPDLQLLVAKICAESENFVNILNPISKKPRSKKTQKQKNTHRLLFGRFPLSCSLFNG